MPQMTDDHRTGTSETEEEEFDFGDLDLSALSVRSMDGPAAKTEFAAADSWPPSCCCYPN